VCGGHSSKRKCVKTECLLKQNYGFFFERRFCVFVLLPDRKAGTASGEGGVGRGDTLPNGNASKESVSLNKIMDFFSKEVFVHFFCKRTEQRTDRERRGRGREGGTLQNENASKQSVSSNKIMDFFSKDVFCLTFKKTRVSP
jgi:hypothetical protein